MDSDTFARPTALMLHLSPPLRTALYSAISRLTPSRRYLYPPPTLRSAMNTFYKRFLIIKPSSFPHGGLGLYLRPNCTLQAGTPLGWYSGILRGPDTTDEHNHYLFSNRDQTWLTDPCPLHNTDFPTYLSRINENIFHSLTEEALASQDSDLPSVNNCHFQCTKTSQFYTASVATSRRIRGGEELTIFLGHDYSEAWQGYYNHLIARTDALICRLLNNYYPTLLQSYRDSQASFLPLLAAHVRSTLEAASPLPGPSLTLLNFVLCCLHNSGFRNATVFRRAYNPKYPQPTDAFHNAFPNPWAHPSSSSPTTPTQTSSAGLVTLYVGPSPPHGGLPAPQEHLPAAESSVILSSAAPQAPPMTQHSHALLSSRSQPFLLSLDIGTIVSDLDKFCAPPARQSGSCSSTPSLETPVTYTDPRAPITDVSSQGMARAASLTSSPSFAALRRPGLLIPPHAVESYSAILNQTPGFSMRGSLMLPVLHLHLPQPLLTTHEPLALLQFLFIPIYVPELPWALLAIDITDKITYWCGAGPPPLHHPAFIQHISAFLPTLPYTSLTPLAFPVSKANSALLIFSIVHSLHSGRLPCAPTNYDSCRRRFAGALGRPQSPAINIWAPRGLSLLACPRTGYHRFGTTCPTCLWNKLAPIDRPSPATATLSMQSFNSLNIVDLPHVTIIPTPDACFTLATYNINGLTDAKLPAIIHLFTTLKLDLLLLVDSRLAPKDHKRLANMLRADLHPQLYVASAMGDSSSPNTRLIGGLTILLHPKWTGHLRSFLVDRLCPHTLARLQLRTTTSLIQFVFTYIPYKPTDTNPGHLWLRTQARLAQGITPLDHTLAQATLWGSANPGPTLLLGDLNGAWPTGGGSHNLAVFQEQGWQSTIHNRIPTTLPFFTRRARDDLPATWIDHILHYAPNPLLQEALTTSSLHHFPSGNWSLHSDHRPLVASFPLGKPLDRPHSIAPTTMYIPKFAMDPAKREEQVAALHSALPPVNDITATTTPETLCDLLDAYSSQLTTSLRTVLPQPRTSKRHYYDGWTPLSMAYKYQLLALQELRRHCLGYHKRPRWTSITALQRGVASILHTWTTRHNALTLHGESTNIAEWIALVLPQNIHRARSLLLHRLTAAIPSTLHQLHGRIRKERRQKFSKFTAKMETALANRKYGTFIRHLLGSKQTSPDLTTITTEAGVLLTDPRLIHNHCTAMANAHFTPTPTHSVLPEDIIDWSSPTTVRSSHNAFTTFVTSVIPPPLLPTFQPRIHDIWLGLTYPFRSDLHANMTQEFTCLHCPTFEEFTTLLRHKPSKAPGPSSITYDILRALPAPHIQYLYDCLAALWPHRDVHVPSNWKWRWLCPIPKSTSDTTVWADLRPLMLLECLRKLWVDLITRQITAALSKHGFLSTNQAGFVRNKSTTTSILHLVTALEETSENSTSLFGSSWDMKKAFDSVLKQITKLSLRRASIPPSEVNFLLALDHNAPTIVRTPYALTIWKRHGYSGFGPPTPNPKGPCHHFCAAAGLGQGDVGSPHFWNLVIDTLLRSLEAHRHANPASAGIPVRASDGLHRVADLAYADDIISLSVSLLGLQLLANLVSLFANLFGLTISLTKLRAFYAHYSDVLPPEADPSITVYDNLWQPHIIVLATSGTVKHLGFHHDLQGTCTEQLQATTELVTSSTTQLRRKHYLSADISALTLSYKVFGQAAYHVIHSSWHLSQLEQLERPINALLRARTRNLPTFPTHLLYAPTKLGGLGLPRLLTRCHHQRHGIMHHMLHSPDAWVMNSLISRLFRSAHIIATPGFAHCLTYLQPDRAGKSLAPQFWARSTAQLALQHGQGLTLPGRNPVSEYASISSIWDMLPDTPEHTRRCYTAAGLHSLNDIIDPSTNRWLHIPNILPLPLADAEPPPYLLYLRTEQCWALSSSPNSIFEIHSLAEHNPGEPFIYIRRWSHPQTARYPRAASDVDYVVLDSTGYAYFDPKPYSYTQLFPPNTTLHRVILQADMADAHGNLLLSRDKRRKDHPATYIRIILHRYHSPFPTVHDSLHSFVRFINEPADNLPLPKKSPLRAWVLEIFIFVALSQNLCVLYFKQGPYSWD